MLTFVIPVKSEKVSSDWGKFCELVERTLRSVCAQTDSDFKVVVVCHEIPKIEFKHQNIEFYRADFSPPKLIAGETELNSQKKEHDKAQKIFLGVRKAIHMRARYTMVVDSDDLISNKLVEYVNTSKGVTGWYIDKGYFFKEGAYYLVKNKKTFNQVCGTSIVIDPNYIEELFEKSENGYLLYKHHITELENDKIMKAIPFPAAVYSMMNGENHYFTMDYAISKNKPKSLFRLDEIRRLFGKFLRYSVVWIYPRLRKEFGLYKVSNH